MDIYTINLTGLLGLCAALFVAQQRPTKKTVEAAKDNDNKKGQAKTADGSEAVQWSFLIVYSLVMGADWLQGPFLYPLYRDEHGISASLVSTLFTTGFLSGGVSGYFIGSVADSYGRKAACLFFCVAYALSCLLTMVPSVPLLFAGRTLGGISTSLLFSVFESWMVTDFHNRGLQAKGGDLSRTFGLMSTLNSIVAIFSGVSSEWLVSFTGTRKSPFAASAILLGVAFWLISTTWAENYGESASKKKPSSGSKDAAAAASNASSQASISTLLSNPPILALALASTMFEGSMYLFVFFWTPALKSVQADASAPLPYGIIFAAFMAAVLASSLAFNLIMERGLVRYTALLAGLLGVSEIAFYFMARPSSEQAAFWLFCVFEACVGMYWPSMGYLKGQFIEDGVRARVYGFLRIPLNVFVVVSLLLTGDGEAFGSVFSNCSTLLLTACGGMTALMLNQENLP